ncbi:tRNA (adenosine(37)-N6)-threonylcarbamoyltransferase complex dimerization subunit type 1 TsaB [Thalassotalea fusca]
MKYLAIDASTEACSVALSVDGHVTHEFEHCPQSHSLVLLPMVDRVLKQAKVSLSELDGIIYGRGPGSFTGVRIGIGVVQGLAFAANLRLVGVSTMQAMAQQAYSEHGQTSVLAAIDARMSEVYTCLFQVDADGVMQPVTQEQVLPPEQVSPTLPEGVSSAYAVGTGFDAYADVLSALKAQSESPQVLYPNAKAMLPCGMALFEQGESLAPEDAQPTYVRDTVSWKKLPGRE